MDNIQYNADFWRYYISSIIIGIVFVVLVTMIADEMFKFKCEKTFWFGPNPLTEENDKNQTKDFDMKISSMTEMMNWVSECLKKAKELEFNKFVFMEIIGALSICIGLSVIDQSEIASGGLIGAGLYIVTYQTMIKLTEYNVMYGILGSLLIFGFIVYCAKYMFDLGVI